MNVSESVSVSVSVKMSDSVVEVKKSDEVAKPEVNVTVARPELVLVARREVVMVSVPPPTVEGGGATPEQMWPSGQHPPSSQYVPGRQ